MIVLLFACAPAVEEPTGVAPEVDLRVDLDNDGLPDVVELELGLDHKDPDSDGDRYLDGWEVGEGTDARDPRSRIYSGNWPYNPQKDGIAAPHWADDTVGATMVRAQLLDAWGEDVDLYDFAGHGTPTVVAICPSCECGAFLYWLAGEPPYYFPNLLEAVGDGRVNVVVVFHGANDRHDLQEWSMLVDQPRVAVVSDPDRALGEFWTFQHLDPAMRIVGSGWGALTDLDAGL